MWRETEYQKKIKANQSVAKYKLKIAETVFIFAGAGALFLLLSLISYHTSDSGWSHITLPRKIHNLGGYAGAWFADVFLSGFGYVAYLLPILLIYTAWLPCQKLRQPTKIDDRSSLLLRGVSLFLALFSASSLLALNFTSSYLPLGNGGIIGHILGGSLIHVFDYAGTNLLLLAVFLGSITMFTDISWLRVAEKLGIFLIYLSDFLGEKILNVSWGAFFKNVLTLGFLRSSRNKNTTQVAKILHQIVEEAEEEGTVKEPRPKKSRATTSITKDTQLNTLVSHSSDNTIPSLSLLDLSEKSTAPVYTKEQLERVSREVELRLNDFGIDAQVVAVYPGPVVTRFELQLAAGTKVSKITTLAKDLARSLSVISVRVVEVIPGKSYVGLELPNKHREIVRLRDVLSSQQYESSRVPLAMALGKDISGYPVVVDLAKMPHLLVAGTTGSGKSVCLNALLLSLLYKYTAKEVRLLMIDPKMLELSIYDGIPHLLAPVVTDMRDAANALRWCVYEMERRYKLLATVGVRNLSGYNHKVKEAREKGKPLLNPFWQAESGTEGPEELQELPYIVVLADEYADMIMVVGKKVEELIARIAQKARAAGIHLILATQRPSVDVITGLIKANIATRIAFQVSSKIDSRTILDQSGAEQLLGAGDMLYLPPGSGVPIRVHGAFVADEEVHRVVHDLKLHSEPEYLDDVLTGSGAGSGLVASEVFAPGTLGSESDDSSSATTDDENDPLYDQAVQIVIETRRASISSLQRRLRIGYNRSARLIDTMEQAGLVSAMESNGNRTVLVNGGKHE